MHKKDVSRITVDIPIDSHRKLKSIAALLGKSMREIIIESIDQSIEQATEGCSYSHVPNKRLRKAIENAEAGKNLVECASAADLFKKLGS